MIKDFLLFILLNKKKTFDFLKIELVFLSQDDTCGKRLNATFLTRASFIKDKQNKANQLTL